MTTFGWADGSDGNRTYTVPGHSWSTGYQPPELDGFEVFFVAHVGQEYTRWTYRPISEPAVVPITGDDLAVPDEYQRGEAPMAGDRW